MKTLSNVKKAFAITLLLSVASQAVAFPGLETFKSLGTSINDFINEHPNRTITIPVCCMAAAAITYKAYRYFNPAEDAKASQIATDIALAKQMQIEEDAALAQSLQQANSHPRKRTVTNGTPSRNRSGSSSASCKTGRCRVRR